MNLWFTHPCFDKDKVQKELDLQREVTESFGQTVTQTRAMIADKLSEASRKKKYEAAVELENAKKAREENDSETNRTWEEQAKANFDTANREAKEWETGGSQRRILDSALNVVSTFLAGRPAAEVVASGLSPAINHQIKEMTTDKDGNVNTPVNLMAHAIWGGIEAYAGNRNAAAGVAGAAAGEAAASAISNLLYDKSPDKLTQEEKLTVSTLSQAAASIAGGTLANNADGAIIAAKTAKDAVENNSFALDGVMNNSQVDWLANAKAQEKISAAERKAMEDFEKSHPDLVENLRVTGNIADFLANFTPVVGDVKSFAEAEDGIDYTLSVIGIFPPAKTVTKSLKEFKNTLRLAKSAEKAGNVAESVRYQREAIKQLEAVKALDVGSYKNLRMRSEVGDNLDLDHIPSFAAQIKNLEKSLGRQLTREEKYKLKNEATAIAIPKEVHKNSRTYGGRNTSSQTLKDAKDLCEAQCLDLEQNKNNLLNYGFDENDINQAIEKVKNRNLERGIK